MKNHQQEIFELDPKRELRALSWWNPFAFLMFYHKIETRKWKTDYRGDVLICTTKANFDRQPESKTIGIIPDYDQIEACGAMEALQKYPTHILNGYAIGVGTLVDCRPVKFDDLTFFNHSLDLYAHVYEKVRRIEPFPLKGSQGWFKATEYAGLIRHL